MISAHVVAIARDGERYIFVFCDETDVAELHRTVGRYAADPDLSFTWLDASVVVQRARTLMASTRG